MTLAFQASLLAADDETSLGALRGVLERTELADGAWVDVRRSWLTGADQLFEQLLRTVPWQGERRQMYDRVVDVPRLLCFYDEHDTLPDPVLVEVRAALDAYYRPQPLDRFRTVGMCLYRDHRDSVAWHGDRTGRSSSQDTMVAIVSLGSPRPLLLRPRAGGGTTHRYELGHGDLIVMGGSCQRTWDHAIPKTARPVGPRISIQYRPQGVR
jgi:alkylated DNA repair dioxygenase AlkB